MTFRRGDPRIKAKYLKRRDYYRAYGREYQRRRKNQTYLGRLWELVTRKLPEKVSFKVRRTVRTKLIDLEKLANPQKRVVTRASKIQWLNAYKSQKPCVDCGHTFIPQAMDFDHRDASHKVGSLSVMLFENCSFSLIKAEIAKCDLVCATCHRIRTHNRRAERKASNVTPTLH